MSRFFEKTKASVAIFLILILAPMYTCAYMIVDLVRYSAAEVEIREASELAGNSALANYDEVFKDVYGLFIMSESEEELSQSLSNYFSAVIDSAEGIYESSINTKVKDFTASFDENYAITNVSVLDAQIRDYMKYKAPYKWTMGLSQKISAFINIKNAKSEVEDSKKYYEDLPETDVEAVETVSAETAKQQKANIDKISSTKTSDFLTNFNSIKISDLISSEIYDEIKSSEGTIKIEDFSKLKDAIQNCYEVEYFAEKFTSLLDDADEDRPVARGEFEYIVFGNDNTRTNISECLDLIFSIRLILNCAFVYTNASMRQSALAVATTIAGWTGVGIPIVQNALLLSWATAESVLDLSSLIKGETVPIYKTSSTWTLGLSGLANAVVSDVASYACKKVDDVFSYIEDFTFDKADEVSDVAESYIDDLCESSAESLASMISVPVEKAVNKIINSDRTDYTKEEITALLKSAVNSVDSTSKGVKTAKQLFISYCLPTLADKIYESLQSGVSENISSAIDSAYKTLLSKIKSQMSSYVSDAKEKFSDSLEGASDDVKESLVSLLQDYSDTLLEYVGADATTTPTTSSFVGMSYLDYLKMFALIGLSSDSTKTNMLKRTIIIMQINCVFKSAGFNITKCYFAVNLKSEVNVGLHKIKHEEMYSY